MEKTNVKINPDTKKPLLGRGWGGSSPSLGGVGEASGEASATKILVIQQKMIGDVLVSSLICENLKLNFPNAEIHYLVNSFTLPVIKNNPFIDKIIVFEDEYRSSKLALFNFLMQIRNAKYDIIIDAYGKLESNLISLFSKAKTKISWEKSYTKFIYTNVYNKLEIAKTNAGLAVEDRLNLLTPFQITTELQNRPKIYLTKAEVKDAEDIIQKFNINISKPLFMISALGSDASKTYPFTYMAKVLDHIIENSEAQLIFNYMPKQKAQVLEIYNLCSKATQNKIQLDLSPQSLREFIALTSHCDALIGNEGGAVNMAKAVGVPTFTIFSPWIDKKAWSSFEDGKKNISVHLEDIKPEYYQDVIFKSLKLKSENLYKEFSVEYVNSVLSDFLTQF